MGRVRIRPEARIGNQIRLARLAKGWTQDELGARCDPPISHAAVSDIERAKTHLPVERLTYVAGVLEQPLSYFIEELERTGVVEGERRIMISLARYKSLIESEAHLSAIRTLLKEVPDGE